MADAERHPHTLFVQVAQKCDELGDVRFDVAVLERAAKFGAEQRSAEVAAAQVAAVAPARDTWAGPQNMKRAHDDEIGDETREPGDGDVAALRAMARVCGSNEVRRDPMQHCQRPENESLETMAAEDGTNEFHGAQYEDARAQSD